MKAYPRLQLSDVEFILRTVLNPYAFNSVVGFLLLSFDIFFLPRQ